MRTINLLESVYSVQDIVNLYKYTSSGHWFDRYTMRFFKTRLSSSIKKLDKNNVLFITSEQGPSGIRRYSVRKCFVINTAGGYDKLRIETLGEFQQFDTLPKAKSFMNSIAGYHKYSLTR